MTLEKRLRRHAAKREFVHLSVAFTKGLFYANLAAASLAGGYAQASDVDPVRAIEKAFEQNLGGARAPT